MSLTAQNMMDRASIIIQDLTNTRWPANELIGWLNDGRREMAIFRPDIYAATASPTLVAGAKQTLPSGGIRLMDVQRNASGPAVTITQRGYLDQHNPNWYQMPSSLTIKHFMLDERDPQIYWVYPPAKAGSSVEIIYQQIVTDYTSSSTLATYEELYSGALVDYVCYRAFSKDAEYAGNADRAIAHYNQFVNSLKTGGTISIATSPNVHNVGGAKQVQG